MANYTTSTSDKSRKRAIILLIIGGIGLHLFYVGRIKSGLIRFVLGVLCWVLIITGISEQTAAMIGGGVILLLLFNAVDFVKLLLGTFRDNIGTALRA